MLRPDQPKPASFHLGHEGPDPHFAFNINDLPSNHAAYADCAALKNLAEPISAVLFYDPDVLHSRSLAVSW